jgi:hypothetical protein
MIKHFFHSMGLAVCLFFMAGCYSELYYQEQAVQRARAFLLENSRNLDQLQLDYIRFNDPVLLSDPIYSGRKKNNMNMGINTELYQICVAWQIPESDELIMVYGASNAKMEHWYPERLIRKNYITGKKELQLPLTKIRNYAVTNFVRELTAAELNTIRFSLPAVAVTDFAVSSDPQVKLSETMRETAEKQFRKGLQVSYYWKKSSTETVVFCGYFKPGFKSWQLQFAGIIPTVELNAHTVKQLRTPQNFNIPVSTEEKALFPKAASADAEETDPEDSEADQDASATAENAEEA